MQQPAPILVVGRDEDLVRAELASPGGKLIDRPDDLCSGEVGTGSKAVVEHAADLEAVLGEHAHPPEQDLAGGSRADHQDALGPDPAAAQPGLVLAQQVALGRHQDGRQDHGVENGQAGVVLAQVEEGDRGQEQQGREADSAVEAEEKVDQGPTTPGAVLPV